MSYQESQAQARLRMYIAQNFNFSIYYQKLYAKEMLPSRIRYNQFFFWGAFVLASKYLLFRPMFAQSSNENNLGATRFYTSERAVVNPVARMLNRSAAASHASQQEYIF